MKNAGLRIPGRQLPRPRGEGSPREVQLPRLLLLELAHSLDRRDGGDAGLREVVARQTVQDLKQLKLVVEVGLEPQDDLVA